MSVRIGLSTIGSRGDVQPMVAVGQALRKRGVEVELGGPPNDRGMIEQAGLIFTEIPCDTQAFLASTEGQRIIERGDGRSLMREVTQLIIDGWDSAAETIAAIADRSDAFISNPLTMAYALSVIDPARTPYGMMMPFPLMPTRAYRSPLLAGRPFPFGFMNYATHALVESMSWRPNAAPSAKWRRKRGFEPLRRRGAEEYRRMKLPIFLAWDESLCPIPSDAYTERVSTGQWSMEEPLWGGVSPELDAWLSAGEKPLYIGFGSMMFPNAERLFADIARVAERLDQRVLLVTGWSDLVATHTGRVRVEQAVDHTSVLPRCSVAVHHGGAGTTHAGLRAGLPAVLCPVLGDQFFWAWRVQQLGVGVSHRLLRLDADKLEEMITFALTPQVQAQAKALSATMRSDGSERAADAILRMF